MKTQYIIVKGAGGGGLGDRLRAVITAIVYAKLTNRVLFVDWGDGKLIPSQRNIFIELFRLKDIACVTTCPQSENVYPPAWRGRLSDSLDALYIEYDPNNWDRIQALKRFSFDQLKLDYPQEVLVMWDFDQFEQLAALNNRSSALQYARALVQQHISVHSSIAEQAQAFCDQHQFDNRKTIGLHIRATQEFANLKSSVQLSQYEQVCRKLLNQGAEQIYLATDNSEVEAIFKEKFSGKVIVREKWFDQPGEKLHFNGRCPDPETALKDAMTELSLLASCDFLIYQQNSSFGICAHLLSNSKDEDIFALFSQASLSRRVIQKLRACWKKLSRS